MYFPFKVSSTITSDKIKAGEEFKVDGFKVSIHSIPNEWIVQLIDDRIIIGRKDGKYTTRLEIHTMLMIAVTVQKQNNFNSFMKSLGLNL